MYRRFLNDIYQAHHVQFWVETQKIIDKVANGDALTVGNISEHSIKVERVVDIVHSVFNLPLIAQKYQVTHPQQQTIIHNLLGQLQIQYESKQGWVKCQDLQVQLMFEYERLTQKQPVKPAAQN